METKLKKNLQNLVATRLANELEQLLKHGWSEMVWDAISEAGPNLSDEEKEEVSESISWTLIDATTGKDLLNVPTVKSDVQS